VSVQVSPRATDGLTGLLRGVLERRYHHLHPFNQRMHRGELSREEKIVRAGSDDSDNFAG